MRLHMVIDNVYDDDEQGANIITNEYDVEVEAPEVEDQADDLEEWAYETIFPHTGTGREHGEAAYFAKITACTERPDLVGREFEWGT